MPLSHQGKNYRFWNLGCSSKLFLEFSKLSNGAIFVFICQIELWENEFGLHNTVDFFNMYMEEVALWDDFK